MEQLTGEGFSDVSGILGCGVYALVWRGEIVYVGQSRRLLQRVYSHRVLWERKRAGQKLPKSGPASAAKAIRFDNVYIRLCHESDLDRIELELIRKFKPRYNTRGLPIDKISLAAAGFDLAGLIKAHVPVAPFNRRFG